MCGDPEKRETNPIRMLQLPHQLFAGNCLFCGQAHYGGPSGTPACDSGRSAGHRLQDWWVAIVVTQMTHRFPALIAFLRLSFSSLQAATVSTSFSARTPLDAISATFETAPRRACSMATLAASPSSRAVPPCPSMLRHLTLQNFLSQSTVHGCAFSSFPPWSASSSFFWLFG